MAATAERVYGGDRASVTECSTGWAGSTARSWSGWASSTPSPRWRPPVGSPPPSPEGTARLAVFEGAGHFTWKDTPDRYWPLLLEFVAGAGR